MNSDKRLYHDRIMEHYKNPRNTAAIATPSFSSGKINPSCGDRIIIEGTVVNEYLSTVRIQPSGCVLSQAAASLLSEYVLGKSVSELQAIDAQKIQDLVGMSLGMLRLQCALLPLQALHKGILHYQSKKEVNK